MPQTHIQDSENIYSAAVSQSMDGCKNTIPQRYKIRKSLKICILVFCSFLSQQNFPISFFVPAHKAADFHYHILFPEYRFSCLSVFPRILPGRPENKNRDVLSWHQPSEFLSFHRNDPPDAPPAFSALPILSASITPFAQRQWFPCGIRYTAGRPKRTIFLMDLHRKS